MPTDYEIAQAIRENPHKSDKKIAKKLHISSKQVKAVRLTFSGQGSGGMGSETNRLDRTYLSYFSEKKILVGIFLLAVVVRIIYVVSMAQTPMLSTPLLDAASYLEWAKQIAAGNSMGSSAFFVEPLYAYLLAIFLVLFKTNGPQLLIFVQLLCGALLPLFVFSIAKQIFNRQVGFIAAFITAIYGPFVFYENLLLKTSLEVFTLAVLLFFFLKTIKTTNTWLYVCSGVLLGIVSLLKGNNLVLFPIFLLGILYLLPTQLKQKITLMVAFSVGFLVALSPATIHNYVVAHDFVPTNYSIGMVVYQGSWWNSDGSLLQPPFIRPDPKYEETDSKAMADAFAHKNLKASQVSQFWLQKTLQEVVANPGRWIGIECNKVLLLVNKTEMADNYDYGLYKKYIPFLGVLPDFWFVASFALTGIVLLLVFKSLRTAITQRPEGSKYIIFFIGILVAYSGLVLSGHVNSRYRIAITPLFIILCSATIWYLIAWIRQNNLPKAIFTGVLFLAFVILTALHLPNFDSMTDANFYNNLGAYYLDKQEYNFATYYFQHAIAVSPTYLWAYKNLFLLYLRNGDIEKAKQMLQKQIMLQPEDPSVYDNVTLFNELKSDSSDIVNSRLDEVQAKLSDPGPDQYDPYFYEAQRYLSYGNTTKAISLLQQSAQAYNNPEITVLDLAHYENQSKQTGAAKSQLESLVAKHPDFFPARYNLAGIYINQHHYQDATKMLQPIYALVPEYEQTWYFLILTQLQNKNFTVALPMAHKFVKTYQNDQTKAKEVAYIQSIVKTEKTTTPTPMPKPKPRPTGGPTLLLEKPTPTL